MEIYKLGDVVPGEETARRGKRKQRGLAEQTAELGVGAESILTKRHKYDRIESSASQDVGDFGGLDEKLARDCESNSGGLLAITGMTQGVKNPNRVNVFVNGEYAFSLEVAQVVDLGVKVGQKITAEDLAGYKRASEFGKNYQKALEWVLTRPHSVKELRDYLKRRDFKAKMAEHKKEWEKQRAEELKHEDEVMMPRHIRQKKRSQSQLPPRLRVYDDFADLIVERLTEKGYVDDEKFARYYVENRFVKKGVSKKRLEMELMRKGISADIIGMVLDDRNDEAELLKMIEKKHQKYSKDKLIAYLHRQGFSYELVRELVEKWWKEHDGQV